MSKTDEPNSEGDDPIRTLQAMTAEMRAHNGSLGSHSQWPPTRIVQAQMLRTGGRDREQWTAEDWRQYAESLERAVAVLYREKQAADREAKRLLHQLVDASSRLARRKKEGFLIGLLARLAPPPLPSRPRAGRPTGSAADEAALAVLALQSEMQSRHPGKVSLQQALDQLIYVRGRAVLRGRNKRTVINRASLLGRKK
jgi:hypothetical protein